MIACRNGGASASASSMLIRQRRITALLVLWTVMVEVLVVTASATTTTYPWSNVITRSRPALPESLTGRFDISVLPAISGQRFANYRFEDVAWDTLDLTNMALEATLTPNHTMTYSLRHVGLSTKPTRFELFQSVSIVTITCGGTLQVRVPDAAISLTAQDMATSLRADVDIGVVDVKVTLDSGLCAIAAAFVPSLTTSVEQAVRDAIQAENLSSNIEREINGLLNSNNSTSFLATVEQVLDKLQDLAPGSLADRFNASKWIDALGDVDTSDRTAILEFVLDKLQDLAPGSLADHFNASKWIDALGDVDTSDRTAILEFVLDKLLDIAPKPLADLFKLSKWIGSLDDGSSLDGSSSSLDDDSSLDGSSSSLDDDSSLDGSSSSLDDDSSLDGSGSSLDDDSSLDVSRSSLDDDSTLGGSGSSLDDDSSLDGSGNGSSADNSTADALSEVVDTAREAVGECVDALRNGAHGIDPREITHSRGPANEARVYAVVGLDMFRTLYLRIAGNPEFSVKYSAWFWAPNALWKGTLIGPRVWYNTTAAGHHTWSDGVATLQCSISLDAVRIAVNASGTHLTVETAAHVPSVIEASYAYIAGFVVDRLIPVLQGDCPSNGSDSTPAPLPTMAPSTPSPLAPPPSICAYRCPDQSCAASLGACSCTSSLKLSNLTASFDGVAADGRMDPRFALSVVAFAAYALQNASGACAAFPYASLLKFQWTVTAASSPSRHILTVNASTLRIGALRLNASTNYTFTAMVQGLRDSDTMMRSWDVFVFAPDPVVSITHALGATLRISTSKQLIVRTKIEDIVNGISSSAYAWSCTVVQGDVCPSLSNATIEWLTIAANAPNGTFNITFTYRTAFKSMLQLTLLADAIPSVRLVLATSPLATVGVPMFLWASRLSMVAAVSPTVQNASVAWYVNNQLLPNAIAQTLDLNTSTLNATSLSAISFTDQHVINSIRVRVAAKATPHLFGEASLEISVLQKIVVSLTTRALHNATASQAAALTDDLSFSVASTAAVASLPLWLSTSYAFGFVDNGRKASLQVTPIGDGISFVATAPTLSTFPTAVVQTEFHVVLRVNNIDAATSTASFRIAEPPDLQVALQAQVQLAGTVSDPGTALQLASNLQGLMGANTNRTAAIEMAGAVSRMIASTVHDAASLTKDQQGTLFSALATASDHSGSGEKSSLQSTTKNLLSSVLSAGSLDPDNGATALVALATLPANETASLASALANIMANDASQSIGTVRLLQATGIAMASVKQAAAALGGMAVSATGMQLVLPADLSIPGLDEDALVGVASTIFTSNPYGSDGGSAPLGVIVSVELSTAATTAISVTNLNTRITIQITGHPGVTQLCKYWDAILAVWSTIGVTTSVGVDGSLTCSTNHLTSFASFSSPADGQSTSNVGTVAGIVVGVVGGCVLIVIAVVVVDKQRSAAKNAVADLTPANPLESGQEEPAHEDSRKVPATTTGNTA